jgi:hypothetical protein
LTTRTPSDADCSECNCKNGNKSQLHGTTPGRHLQLTFPLARPGRYDLGMSDDEPNAAGNLSLIVMGLLAGGATFLWIASSHYGATRRAIAAPGGVLIGFACLIVMQSVVRWILNSSRRK